MTAGLCMCVVLVVLCSSCWGLPVSPQLLRESQRSVSAPSEGLFEDGVHNLGEYRLPHSRSAPQPRAPPPPPPAQDDSDSRANLSELLARLISTRKGSVRRNSTTNHRIADRDYVGWLDFGRRSAEEYEYNP